MSDFLLQKSPERGGRYHKAPGIWLLGRDAALGGNLAGPHHGKRCTTMPSPVPNYDVSPMARKLERRSHDHRTRCGNGFPLAWTRASGTESCARTSPATSPRTHAAGAGAASLELEAAGPGDLPRRRRQARPSASTRNVPSARLVAEGVTCLAEIDRCRLTRRGD